MVYNIKENQPYMFFLFYTFIILISIYNLLKFFSEKEEQQLSSIELLDTMSFKNTISEHDEPYVKLQPDPKSIENDVNNLESGHDVCLF